MPSHSPTPIHRRIVDVAGRRVHYLRTGEGPPAVLVHSSPTNAWYVAPQMRQLADRFTCFAFDTPGFGLSQALVGEELRVEQLAQALADNMAAIGLPPCPVYGTHTGAAIALSLGAHRPERVTAVVLDGVPVFSADELGRLFEGYFEPLRVEARGGHYAQTWTRFRDQYVWFPWTHKRPEHHNDVDLGSADAVHAWTMSFFYAGRTYKPAYRAAIHYSDEAVVDAGALRCPAVFTATENDMLYPHLDRLPPLGAAQSIRRIGNDKAARDALIPELFEQWPATGPAPSDRFALAHGAGIRQQFVDLPNGQVLLRHAGSHDAPAVLLLHDAPGSAAALADAGGLIEQLAERQFVLAPDLPGCGESDPLAPDATGSAPALAAWGDAIAAVCKQAGVTHVCVYGIGFGASLALVLAERHPALAGALVLRGLALPEPAERTELLARYAPRIAPEADGSHWYRTWLMLRDQRIFFPWYDTRASRQRRVPADLDADRLHDATFEVMKQHGTYHQVIEAALAHNAAASLAALAVPLALCHDPQVPLFAHDGRLRAACPKHPALPTEPGAHAAALAEFVSASLAGAGGGPVSSG